MSCFDLYWCRFLVESSVHSVIALIVVEASLKIWDVSQARERFRFRLQILLLPPLMFPLFQLLNPRRGSFFFVEDTALLSVARWLDIRLWDTVPLALFFFLVLIATAALTFFQELFPILRAWTRKPRPVSNSPAEERLAEELDELSAALDVERPVLEILDDPAPVLFISGVRNPCIVLSRGLKESLTPRELRGALAHEMAHVARRSGLTTVAVFLARILMFYNPVSLLAFRRVVQDDEEVCDSMTLAVTRDPESLASALLAFRVEGSPRRSFSPAALKESIARASRNLLLEERIERLSSHSTNKPSNWSWLGFGLTMAGVALLCYRVV